MADIKINALTPVTAADDIQFETDQGGSVAGKITLLAVKNYVLAALATIGNIILVRDTEFTLQNATDATKQARFSLANVTTASVFSYILPGVTGAVLATLGNISQTFAGAVTVTGTFIANAAAATIGSSTAATTIGIGIGATLAAVTKTINIGIAGVSTSITNINIGSAVAGALGTLTINSVTTIMKALQATTASFSGAITSTLVTGNPPLVVASTTPVANLNVSQLLNVPSQGYRPRNLQTGTSYTPVLADAGQQISMANAAANTFTIPLNATVAYPVGTEIEIVQEGAGATSIAATGGVTLNSLAGNRKIAGQWGGVTIKKTATDTWLLIGGLIA